MKTKSNLIGVKEVCDFLNAYDNFLILSHASPDGDTLGSAAALYMGLKSAGKNCFIACGDTIPSKYNYFFEEEFKSEIAYDKIIAVDVADESLLGSLCEKFTGKIDLCIDHHISNTLYAKQVYLDANASAACECIYDIIKAMNFKMTDKMAAALYTGISTDTGSFKYSNVTAKTHIIAAELHGYNINADVIAKKMFDTKSKALLKLERMVLRGAEFYFDDLCLLLAVTSEMLEKTGCSESELESVAAHSRCVEGVIAGVTVKQKDTDTFKVSLRTYEPLDAAEICKSLGGGGHRAAAGCTLKGTLSEVKEQILGAVKQALEENDAGISAC